MVPIAAAVVGLALGAGAVILVQNREDAVTVEAIGGRDGSQAGRAARATGSYDRKLASLARIPLLVIDDFGGWAKIDKTFCGKGGIWDQLFASTR